MLNYQRVIHFSIFLGMTAYIGGIFHGRSASMNPPVVHIETTLTSPRINASSAAHCGRTWPWQVYRAGEVYHSHVAQVFGKKIINNIHSYGPKYQL